MTGRTRRTTASMVTVRWKCRLVAGLIDDFRYWVIASVIGDELFIGAALMFSLCRLFAVIV